MRMAGTARHVKTPRRSRLDRTTSTGRSPGLHSTCQPQTITHSPTAHRPVAAATAFFREDAELFRWDSATTT